MIYPDVVVVYLFPTNAQARGPVIEEWAVGLDEAARSTVPGALARPEESSLPPWSTSTWGSPEITAANLQAAPDRTIGSLGAVDPMGTLGRIQSPALVVHAALDPLPVEWAHALVDTIPGADLALLKGAGHFPHIEDGDQLATAILPLLAKHAV